MSHTIPEVRRCLGDGEIVGAITRAPPHPTPRHATPRHAQVQVGKAGQSRRRCRQCYTGGDARQSWCRGHEMPGRYEDAGRWRWWGGVGGVRWTGRGYVGSVSGADKRRHGTQCNSLSFLGFLSTFPCLAVPCPALLCLVLPREARWWPVPRWTACTGQLKRSVLVKLSSKQ
ncbi:hypothetical protein E2C01_070251 [Portunus trituberculatus]|uniref:Uncharacterized protein n=1 Tax=Portunus trituberculatus TaxID=210409 RepID=A0A5B7I4X5_PORTR|nr:hypothetical protein [Portunus trituberculatus]